MPREGSDAHLRGDLLDVIEEFGKIDVAEERSGGPLESRDMSFDLSSKTADSTQKGSLLLADASTPDDGT